MTSFDTAAFLGSCDVIDCRSDAVRELSSRITSGVTGLDAVAVLFAWVRDSIAHTGDAGHGPITLRASDVLRERTGLCYAKSHLLVALLRAADIPAGLCYQRLCYSDAPPSFVLHGLVGVSMPDHTFLRIDPRGNKPGVDARFVPGREALAFATTLPGEADLPGVFAHPVPQVVAALSAASRWHPTETKLPDVQPDHWPAADAAWHTPLPNCSSSPAAIFETTEPSPADIQLLEDRLYEGNVSATGISDGRALGIFVRDDSGNIIAGAAGHTWGGTCELRQVWVAASARGRGLGRGLIAEAEAEALRRGCRQLILTTHSFQAPELYRKLGFEVLAELPEYPTGYSQLLLRKRLA